MAKYIRSRGRAGCREAVYDDISRGPFQWTEIPDFYQYPYLPRTDGSEAEGKPPAKEANTVPDTSKREGQTRNAPLTVVKEPPRVKKRPSSDEEDDPEMQNVPKAARLGSAPVPYWANQGNQLPGHPVPPMHIGRPDHFHYPYAFGPYPRVTMPQQVSYSPISYWTTAPSAQQNPTWHSQPAKNSSSSTRENPRDQETSDSPLMQSPTTPTSPWAIDAALSVAFPPSPTSPLPFYPSINTEPSGVADERGLVQQWQQQQQQTWHLPRRPVYPSVFAPYPPPLWQHQANQPYPMVPSEASSGQLPCEPRKSDDDQSE